MSKIYKHFFSVKEVMDMCKKESTYGITTLSVGTPQSDVVLTTRVITELDQWRRFLVGAEPASRVVLTVRRVDGRVVECKQETK